MPKLNEINLLDIGNTIQISGVIYSGNGKDYLCFLPGELPNDNVLTTLNMDIEDWKKFIRQTDIMETEILEQAADGKLAKVIVRKTQRQIDQGLQWKVFQRDNYTCRYCGATGIPMTVDHLILWEEGGPTIEENLLSACRKCNKTRGNMQYKDWLDDPYYKKVSKNLSNDIRTANVEVMYTLDKIEKVFHRRSR